MRWECHHESWVCQVFGSKFQLPVWRYRRMVGNLSGVRPRVPQKHIRSVTTTPACSFWCRILHKLSIRGGHSVRLHVSCPKLPIGFLYWIRYILKTLTGLMKVTQCYRIATHRMTSQPPDSQPPEDVILNLYRCENVKSRIVKINSVQYSYCKVKMSLCSIGNTSGRPSLCLLKHHSIKTHGGVEV